VTEVRAATQAPKEQASSGEVMQQARSEGVPGADGVHDVHGRGRDGDAEAVEGGEGVPPAEGDNDEARAGGVPGVARLFRAGTALWAWRWFGTGCAAAAGVPEGDSDDLSGMPGPSLLNRPLITSGVREAVLR
jgi:hypothetical protein